MGVHIIRQQYIIRFNTATVVIENDGLYTCIYMSETMFAKWFPGHWMIWNSVQFLLA